MLKINNEVKRHVIAALVDNEYGTLARVVGLFSARGYNIESLTVAQVDAAAHLSRITIVTSGTSRVIEQIKVQLQRIVPVYLVSDLTNEGAHIERELALIKVLGSGEFRNEALRVGDIFRARVVDATVDSLVFEVTGTSDKIDAFVALLQPLGLQEVCRTGVTAIARGTTILNVQPDEEL
jgi:acetolactate synthase-1/3 small subunit